MSTWVEQEAQGIIAKLAGRATVHAADQQIEQSQDRLLAPRARSTISRAANTRRSPGWRTLQPQPRPTSSHSLLSHPSTGERSGQTTSSRANTFPISGASEIAAGLAMTVGRRTCLLGPRRSASAGPSCGAPPARNEAETTGGQNNEPPEQRLVTVVTGQMTIGSARTALIVTVTSERRHHSLRCSDPHDSSALEDAASRLSGVTPDVEDTICRAWMGSSVGLMRTWRPATPQSPTNP